MNTTIVPVVIPVENNCIIQAGKKFCEQSDMTSHEYGVALLVMAALFAYFGFLMWLSDRLRDMRIVPLGIFALMAIVGIILL